MAVERVDYYSDEEYRQALQEEEQSWNNFNKPEPDVIPCYLCECSMYQENQDLKYNICQSCKNIINGIKESPQSELVEVNDLPF